MKYNNDMIYLEARNAFFSNRAITSAIKCAIRCNHCRAQHTIINKDLIEEVCSRCNETES